MHFGKTGKATCCAYAIKKEENFTDTTESNSFLMCVFAFASGLDVDFVLPLKT